MRRREIALATPEAEGDGGRDPQFVTALARGLDVLRAFRRGDPPLGNQELAQRTGLPKATVSRLTYTLSSLGFLTYAPVTAKYTLSIKALALGFTALGSMSVRDVARPHMQALANETGVSVALGAQDGTSMVYIEHCRGASPLHMGIEVGSHISLARSAMGRAFLAGLDLAERAQLMEALSHRDNWAEIRQGIEDTLAGYAERGFVLLIGDWRQEINAVGVPLVVGSGGSLTFALNCCGPAVLLSRDDLIDRVGPRLMAVADAIRNAMCME
ncbi:MAG: IclR family transcriptional regulator [Chelatococcus sp.]|uniref:IclR family transcriptional regulator n=1 Tax=Chelatococcus sp. TaxID=1953771 RepID=UPI0025C2E124|nr:IclR family transcriptional regulator [Chelatococcus sp.]MBX3536800.1 IclR family transcriptional regulator [Chelatococcus sp.]